MQKRFEKSLFSIGWVGSRKRKREIVIRLFTKNTSRNNAGANTGSLADANGAGSLPTCSRFAAFISINFIHLFSDMKKE